MIKKNLFQNYLYIFIPIIISSILGLLLFSTIKLEDSIAKKIFQVSTSDVFTIMNNSASMIDFILKESQNYPEDIKKNPLLQQALEENLKILITPNIKYAYLLYRDDRGVFRFLADASKLEEKALVDQKFDIDSPEWLQIYTV